MIASQTISVRATRSEVLALLSQLPALWSGTSGADNSLVRTMQVRIGLAVLGRIRRAFVVKARGGTDEAGDSWPPLSPKTIAYRRRHPGLPPPPARAAKRPSYGLTEKQRKRWWQLYSRYLAIFKGDKGHAAAVAWQISKREGAVTLLMKYGNTQVEILRDTGLLLNSLSPGALPSALLSSPPLTVPEQIFRLLPGEIIVGTNRKHAADHHRGIPGRLPQRRLWPDPSKWPQNWWQDALDQARMGTIDIIIGLLRGAA